jgi:plasmid maintenance system antidote protein VapI
MRIQGIASGSGSEGQALGTTPRFWTSLQSAYDIATSRPTRRIRPVRKTG